ncbi:hypothetical protein [Variovorax sp. GT1P44]|uniref:hypothetical protein n=1 Tax=Variovorax sp. GT1P44 TaxID=3443742 RepID=UPI003F470F0C
MLCVARTCGSSWAFATSAERGLTLAQMTIMPAVQRFVPKFKKCWNRSAGKAVDLARNSIVLSVKKAKQLTFA